ncbi:sensor domain-containing diguanylate cyclase [Paenibacillus xanthanilyticus]|uniref:Sensor domain-containing diguanylate cyclase n=1 Tax=Paenibacillus xanthanilyticus TaxID=1783531 RepID=A0ABV8K4P6_9BACL
MNKSMPSGRTEDNRPVANAFGDTPASMKAAVLQATSMDAPAAAEIMQESFEQWMSETGDYLFDKFQAALFSAEGQLIACTHSAWQSEEDRNRVAATACATGQRQEGMTCAAEPLRCRSGDELLSVLVWSATDGWGGPDTNQQRVLQPAAFHLRSILEARFEHVRMKEALYKQHAAETEATRREAMLEIGKRLHDQNDVSSVIRELLAYIESYTPFADFSLYLSQDFVNGDARIKPLLIRNDPEDLYSRAFLEGVPLQDQLKSGCVRLAIPMSGKQAVYGVLGVSFSSRHWDESEFKAFTLIASTAGSAFENAKLYEQSNVLITELQMINELTKRLNQSLRLSEIFEFTMNELLHIFKADHCCVLQLNREKDVFQYVASNLPYLMKEAVPLDYGYAGIVHRTKEPVITSDYWSTRLVASKFMDETGSRSIIAAPIMDGASIVGVIIVTHKSPNFFSYDNYKLLQVLTTHIGLAISNASLHAEVRRMVITDNLTGLHARHYLNERIQSKQRKDPCGSLVVVDIDHFKQVNDTYGHLVGDQILIGVSDVIRSCIRESDIAARWGGEELAVYLPQIRSEQAFRIAERIRTRVEQGTHPSVTVSCGISEWTFEDDKISVESLFYKADMALYEAKNRGRNRIIVAS